MIVDAVPLTAIVQALIERLESADLSLEESLSAFEQGVALTRECQQALAQAEQKVQQLIESNGELKTEPFDGTSE